MATPNGLVGWWPGEGSATDVAGGDNGTASAVTYGPGEVGQAFNYDGINTSIVVPASSNLTVQSLTIEAWVLPSDFNNPRPIVEYADATGLGYVQLWYGISTGGAGSPGAVYCNLRDPNGGSLEVGSGPGLLIPNAWSQVALTFDYAARTATLYVNGQAVGSSTSAVTVTPRTSVPVNLGYRPVGSSELLAGRRHLGKLDEVSIYNRVLAPSELQAIYRAGTFGKCRAPIPPSIVAQPTDMSAYVGDNVSFAVSAAGDLPLSYQWRLNGVNLAGQTNTSLALADVQLTNMGTYAVLVSNPGGSVLSSNALLTVQPAPQCVSVPSGVAAWWQAESNTLDLVGGNSGSMVGGAGFVPGLVGTAFSFNGAGQKVRVPDAPALNPTDGLAIETWLYAPAYNSSGAVTIIGKDNPYGQRQYMLGMADVGGSWVLRAHIQVPSGFKYFNGSIPIQLNKWYHVAMTYDGAFLRLFVNGVADGNLSVNGPIVSSAEPVLIGGSVPGPWDFVGLLDEPTIYGRALSAGELTGIFSAGRAGKCHSPVPPSIIAQPTDTTAYVADAVAFGVTAVGSPIIAYQWRFEGTDLVGQTNASLVLSNLQLANAGNYAVLVSNPYGSVLSSNAVLTVLPIPTNCVTSPSGLVSWWRAEGTAVDETGRNNGELLGGATFGPGKVGQAFALPCCFSFVRIPPSASLDIGLAAGLTIEAWVNPADVSHGGPVFEWGDGGVSFWIDPGGIAYPPGHFFANLSGGNILDSESVVVQPNVYQHLAVTYDKASGVARLFLNGVVVKQTNLGSFTPNTSSYLTLGFSSSSINTFSGLIDEPSIYNRAFGTNEIRSIYRLGKCSQMAPSIIVQPSAVSTFVGDTVSFSVTASGTAPLTYQWRLGGVDLPGRTDSALTLTNVQLADAGSYSVLVTNAFGATESSSAVLSVTNPPARLRVVSAQTAAGATVDVPIQLLALGNENALGFSLGFPNDRLTYVGVSLGSNAQAASLLLNTNGLPIGRLGLLLSLGPGQTFSGGTQEVVVVSFRAALITSPSAATLAFADQPTIRQVSDAQANPLPAIFANGTVSIAAAVGFEGDLAPRPNGDGQVTVTDWVQAGRFAVQLDSPTNSSEFQRADCAPRATYGDGAITIADWVQAGRYAAGLDAMIPGAGPTTPAGPNLVLGSSSSKTTRKDLTRQVRLPDSYFINGHSGTFVVYLDSLGDENALGFSLVFDPSAITFSGATLGPDAPGASLQVNANQAAAGRVAFAAALQPGTKFVAGTRQVLRLTFNTVSAASGSFPLTLADSPVRREVDDANAVVLPANFINGSVAVFPPPSLNIASSASGINISWPLWATNFALQQTDSIGSPAAPWTAVTNSSTVVNGENLLVLPVAASQRFYRLQQ